MRISKSKYIKTFLFIVIILAILRLCLPNTDTLKQNATIQKDIVVSDTVNIKDRIKSPQNDSQNIKWTSRDVKITKHRIYSVHSFRETFPDNNDVQLMAAKRNGVAPVKDRKEAEHRMDELVYVCSNPYYVIDKLNNSIPYLVPKASILLQDIGQVYYDSLYIKGIPLHKIIVTSVLRTKDDVKKLRNHNANATENSCHLYGTTFDICYNRYKTVENPYEHSRRKVRNDTLKWVLSEVLRDFREQNRCYIKYEVKQGCFHITVI